MHIIRNCDALIKKLDIVAEIEGKVIGSIVYTKSKILGDNWKYHDVITFGPISVHPEHQGKWYRRYTYKIYKKTCEKPWI